MKKIVLLLLGVLFCMPVHPQNAGASNNKEREVRKADAVIVTDFGTMKVKLYDATPKHKANFLKLAAQGFYDSTLFHRVIKDFMIQGGDPDSKNALPEQMLGNGDVGYTIPAEFNDTLFHKKGSLCAARNENPEKASSGCQFYIVQGKIFTDAELDQMESKINMQRKQEAFNGFINKPENASLKERFTQLQKDNQKDSLIQFSRQVLEPALEKVIRPFRYSAYQRSIYKTIGGTPHLDQGYTVYGEVVEGLEVLDTIASQPTGKADRPLKDIRMKVSIAD